jgi:hypothetical protein
MVVMEAFLVGEVVVEVVVLPVAEEEEVETDVFT